MKKSLHKKGFYQLLCIGAMLSFKIEAHTQNAGLYQKLQDLLEKVPEEEKALFDRAYGLMLGAAVGDALGSECELYYYKPIPQERLEKVMKMPGGGTHKTASGQATDDTELAVCFARALEGICKKRDQNNAANFNLASISEKYTEWHKSDPFDCGWSTKVAFSQPNVASMQKEAKEHDKRMEKEFHKGGNKANGSLMRCTPLALFGRQLSDEDLFLCVCAENSLSHANPTVYVAVGTYLKAAITLINNADLSLKERSKRAIKEARKFLKSTPKCPPDYCSREKLEKAIEEVKKWFEVATTERQSELAPATQTIGFIKIAFQRVFYHLQQEAQQESGQKVDLKSRFKKVMERVIGEGGDTDTNACIVGGMVGALYGCTNIPKDYVEKVMNCDVTKAEGKKPRHTVRANYQVGRIIDEIKFLIQNPPKEIASINGIALQYFKKDGVLDTKGKPTGTPLPRSRGEVHHLHHESAIWVCTAAVVSSIIFLLHSLRGAKIKRKR